MDNLSLITVFSLPFLCVMSVLIVYFYSKAHLKQQTDKARQLHLKTQEQLHLITQLLHSNNKLLARILQNDLGDNFSAVSHFNEMAITSPFAAGTMTNDGQSTKLYVGNLDYSATEQELADLFSVYGVIEAVNIPVNRYNGRARGFGFVTFTTPSEAEKALSLLNGADFKGRSLQVNFAKEKESVAA